MALRIPNCHVQDADGVIHLQHKTSGDQATAVNEEQAHIKAAILRLAYLWRRAA
ncbi:hypothetical protein ACIBHY_17230 [Nonomuraea sp. NPDC050547]|uniref:hypothetical protein n=1 Tax=Nonomuraea sp. NPDC050547 TaxID=3364368 RepID=UPI00379892BD